ncbi:hypothetical protein I7I50_10556 [Histoplasma capsulatum G186AR]|uniref:Uncharacterized protein n=1 Tax=Ajellomyces capsulatus TaxID=5037 RepID=A0A8H7Z7R5_AJECA|nr:hypothetical protein I7I52_01795 [Histoplasma capsulatum]QSS69309.1 hypothetical protein I7I50_10556 [Histoplasma capsulatum G186AR]
MRTTARGLRSRLLFAEPPRVKTVERKEPSMKRWVRINLARSTTAMIRRRIRVRRRTSKV